MSVDDAKKLGILVPTKRHKYGAVACVVDGIRFQSKREANRYGVLKILEKAEKIMDLRTQVAYDLKVNSVVIGRYIADFVYIEGVGQTSKRIVEDCKGVRTEMYKWKQKHMKAQYGIEILET